MIAGGPELTAAARAGTVLGVFRHQNLGSFMRND